MIDPRTFRDEYLIMVFWVMSKCITLHLNRTRHSLFSGPLVPRAGCRIGERRMQGPQGCIRGATGRRMGSREGAGRCPGIEVTRILTNDCFNCLCHDGDQNPMTEWEPCSNYCRSKACSKVSEFHKVNELPSIVIVCILWKRSRLAA
jgi:hypothetical protein